MRRNTCERLGKVYYLSSSGITYHIMYLKSKIKVSANDFKLHETVGCKSRKMVAKKKKKIVNKFFPLK